MRRPGFARRFRLAWAIAVMVFLVLSQLGGAVETEDGGSRLTIEWSDNHLQIDGAKLLKGPVDVHYLEAYCRANSQTTDWRTHTVVGHATRKLSSSSDRSKLHLRCHVDDGLVVDHHLTTGIDEVDFRIDARNPTDRRSVTHWAQPCVRVGAFCGLGADTTDDAYAYIRKSFVFIDGATKRMPFEPWALTARYTPGQVWAAPGVPRTDVNPRPLSPLRPSHGLIGCFSHDDKQILAIAFEPYQELFQGVIRCLHCDFRLGGIPAGGRLTVRGKIYIVANDLPALLARYAKDFPAAQSSPDPCP